MILPRRGPVSDAVRCRRSQLQRVALRVRIRGYAKHVKLMIADTLKDGNLLHCKLYAYLVGHYDLDLAGRTGWRRHHPGELIRARRGGSAAGSSDLLHRNVRPSATWPATESNVCLWPPIRGHCRCERPSPPGARPATPRTGTDPAAGRQQPGLVSFEGHPGRRGRQLDHTGRPRRPAVAVWSSIGCRAQAAPGAEPRGAGTGLVGELQG